MHYHVASGLSGYGPDGPDGYATGNDVRETAAAIVQQLGEWSELQDQTARGHAEGHDYESAWHTMMRAESLTHMAHNFSAEREKAPLYADNPALWEETLTRLIGEVFPLDVAEHVRLYVWSCTVDGCEHAEVDQD